MENRYGTAWMRIHYDIAAEVRERDASPEMSRFHDVETEKYLVLPGTDQDLQDIVRTMEGAYIEPFVFLDGVKHESRTRHKDAILSGSIVAVTLSRHVFHITNALQEQGCPLQSGANTFFFRPGALESLVATSREKLLADLAKAGLEHDPAKVYHSITGNAPYFC